MITGNELYILLITGTLALLTGVFAVRALFRGITQNLTSFRKSIEIYKKLRPCDGWWQLTIAIAREPLLIYRREAKDLPETRDMWAAYKKASYNSLVVLFSGIICLFCSILVLGVLAS